MKYKKDQKNKPGSPDHRASPVISSSSNNSSPGSKSRLQPKSEDNALVDRLLNHSVAAQNQYIPQTLPNYSSPTYCPQWDRERPSYSGQYLPNCGTNMYIETQVENGYSYNSNINYYPINSYETYQDDGNKPLYQPYLTVKKEGGSRLVGEEHVDHVAYEHRSDFNNGINIQWEQGHLGNITPPDSLTPL